MSDENFKRFMDGLNEAVDIEKGLSEPGRLYVPDTTTKTLRDEFAMAAFETSVQIVMAVSGEVEAEPVARTAYTFADAMLAERQKVKP